MDDATTALLNPSNEENTFFPFATQAEFEFAELLYVKDEMSAPNIDNLVRILTAHYGADRDPPCENHNDLYGTIDAIQDGNVPWDSFTIKYDGPRPEGMDQAPPWMNEGHEVWFRDPLSVVEDMFANPELFEKMDLAAKRVFRHNKRQYKDVMSGNEAWDQSVSI